MSRDLQPVVLIGAGRSGTNILRDSLTALPSAGTWPCDEINYIWRHGNARHPDDELGPEHATPRVRRYVRRAFRRLATSRDLDLVVEKTCANSLRVGFVDSVLPEARYVFLVRDGRDVVASAIQRWRAPLDLPYLLRKARFVPPSDLPYYGFRYLWSRVRSAVTGDRRTRLWGPRFAGMKDACRTESLAVVCGRQWRRCVERADDALSSLPAGRVHRLRYEDFVSHPRREVRRLADFLGVEVAPERLEAIASRVRPGRVGAWCDILTAAEREEVGPILEPALRRFGYEPDGGGEVPTWKPPH